MQRIWMLSFCILIEGYLVYNKLPEFVTPCKDKNVISKCLKQVLEDLRPRLVKGIPEFQIPSVDPLYMTVITVERRSSRIANYEANLTNVFWTGCKDFRIVETFVNPEALVIRLLVAFPYLLSNSEAYLHGTVLNFEINGAGGGTINFTNVVIDIILNGEVYDYKGKEFIKWHADDISLTIEDVYFVDLYGFLEDPIATHLLKVAVNSGANLLGPTFRSVVRSVGDFIVEAVNRVHKLYPKRVLYPN